MPTNKNATLRYQVLDRCLSNRGKRYGINDLIEACSNALIEYDPNSGGVSRRQVYSDIHFMESEAGFAADIEKVKDGKHVYYRYSDPNYSINSQPLNQTEQAQLKEALLTLGRFKGMPQFEWVDELSLKLESELGLNSSDKKAIEFDQNPFLVGLEHISQLYNAIINKQTLIITYKSFKADKAKDISFTPHFLKQYNNRWFLLGWADNFDPISILALDRIQKIEPDNHEYLESDIDFDEYFEDVIGVSIPVDAKLGKVLLQVNESSKPYILSKPLHGSQKVKEETSNYAIIQLELIPNFELEQLILSYGEGIEVLEPSSLRDRISDRLKTASKKYK